MRSHQAPPRASEPFAPKLFDIFDTRCDAGCQCDLLVPATKHGSAAALDGPDDDEFGTQIVDDAVCAHIIKFLDKPSVSALQSSSVAAWALCPDFKMFSSLSGCAPCEPAAVGQCSTIRAFDDEDVVPTLEALIAEAFSSCRAELLRAGQDCWV